LPVDFIGHSTDVADMRGTEQLLTVAETYAAASAVELTTVSSRVFNDGKKLNAIKGGADILSGRLEMALRWFAENWPAGVDWPAEVSRPALHVDSDSLRPNSVKSAANP
jgi:hypothetical protein